MEYERRFGSDRFLPILIDEPLRLIHSAGRRVRRAELRTLPGRMLRRVQRRLVRLAGGRPTE